MIPPRDSFADIQSSFRDHEEKLNSLLTGNIDLKKRRIINAGPSRSAFDYVTKGELKALLAADKTPPTLKLARLTVAPRTIADMTGIKIYDENGVLIHAFSTTALE